MTFEWFSGRGLKTSMWGGGGGEGKYTKKQQRILHNCLFSCLLLINLSIKDKFYTNIKCACFGLTNSNNHKDMSQFYT